MVPFAIPDVVVSFGWSSLSTWVSGFRGAVLVMALAVYPLVYLPVVASLRGADPGQEELARSLGASRARNLRAITLGQARRAILGGCLLVALVILAEYGAFEILGYRTFTTEIFGEFGRLRHRLACALSLVLVALSLVVLGGDGGPGARASEPKWSRHCAGRPGTASERDGAVLRSTRRLSSALGVPVGSSIYWIFEGGARAS